MVNQQILKKVGVQEAFNEKYYRINLLSEYVKDYYYLNPTFVDIIATPLPKKELESYYISLSEESGTYIGDVVGKPDFWMGPWPPDCPPKEFWGKNNKPHIYILHDMKGYKIEKFEILNEWNRLLFELNDLIPIDDKYQLLELKNMDTDVNIPAMLPLKVNIKFKSIPSA